MISMFLLALAAASNAVMDKVSFHFERSVFSHLNAQFWNGEISWKNKYIGGDPANGLKFRFPVAWLANFLDAWHIFKMLMVGMIILAIICYKPLFKWWIDLLILCFTWNIVFNLFFNKILEKN